MPVARGSHLLRALTRAWRVWRRATRAVPLAAPLYLYTLLLASVYIYLLVLHPSPRPLPADLSPSAPLPIPAAPPSDGALRHYWRGRHFVFCASPGRAGSLYLRAVLGAARGVVALHEPAPQMTGGDLRGVLLEGRGASTREGRARAKVAGIWRALAGTAGGVGYAETSHMFVKSFSDVVLGRVARVAGNVTVVVLQRDVRDVVWSQLRLGWFSEGHSGMGLWYYDPEDVHEAARMLPKWGKVDGVREAGRVERLFRYNADVAARTRKLVREVEAAQREGRLRNVRVVPFRVGGGEREEGERARRFLEGIGLVADEGRLAVLSRQDGNARDVKKGRVEVGIEREEVDRVVGRLLKVDGYREHFRDGLVRVAG